MGLMDRLKAAQAAREHTTGPSAEPDVDLTQADKSGPTQSKAIWGRPSRCPACNDPGYLDRIDLVRRVMYQHCPTCGHRWDIPESETIRATY